MGQLSKYIVTASSIAAFGLLLTSGPLPAQSMGEKTGVDSALDIAPTTADFVKEVATSNLFEIESSKLAQQKGKAGLPSTLESCHRSKLDRLKDASGKDFSSDFDSYQVSAHEDAVSLFERYAWSGDNADLKNWAGKTLPALKQHLEMAENLKKRSGGST